MHQIKPDTLIITECDIENEEDKKKPMNILLKKIF
jgi:hypothetical protein